MLRLGFIILITLVNSACSVFGSRNEETPRYEVLLAEGDKEIRQYSPYVVAKTEMTGEYGSSQNDGFRILAGYIFGDNKSKSKIAMTAPVEQSKSEKIAMTAPVEQTKSATGWTMTFMMPSKYKIDDLPVPNDPRVKFEEIQAKMVAVIRYSGSRSEKSNALKSEELLQWLKTKADYVVDGPVRSAGYDPPWTLPPFRRNEMMVDIRKNN
jgi:hypothetical protein